MPTVTTLIVNMVPEDKKGWVLGITQSVSSLARIIGPALAGVFFEFIGKNSPYLIGGLFLLLMISILKKYIFKKRFSLKVHYKTLFIIFRFILVQRFGPKIPVCPPSPLLRPTV